MALSQSKVTKWFNDKSPKKTIYVPGRLVNFIV